MCTGSRAEKSLAQLEAKDGIVAGAYQKRGRVAWLSGRGDQEPSLAELEGHGNDSFCFVLKYSNAVEEFKGYN